MEIFITTIIGICGAMFGIALQKPKIYHEIFTPLIIILSVILIASMIASVTFDSAVTSVFIALSDGLSGQAASDALDIARNVEPKISFWLIFAASVSLAVWAFVCLWVADLPNKDKPEENIKD